MPLFYPTPDSRRRLFGAACLILACTIAGPATTAAEAAAEDRDDWTRQAYLAELLNQERTALGLHPLLLEPALSRAAQAYADDMSARNYFAVKPPSGPGIEALVEAEGYDAWEVSWQIYKTNVALDTLARSWRDNAGQLADSLFSPTVRQVGAGINLTAEYPLYTLIVGLSQRGRLELVSEKLADRDGVRLDMLKLLNERRRAAGRPDLRSHEVLDRAAQGYAEELLGSFEELSSKDPSPILVERLRVFGYRVQSLGANLAIGAQNAEAALRVWEDNSGQRAQLLDRVYRDVGTGIATAPTADGFRFVWVQCYGTEF
jgi:uncharacterized protein YkwD